MSLGAGQGRDSIIIKDSSCPAQNRREAQEKAQWQGEADWERLTSEPGLIPESSVTLNSLPPLSDGCYISSPAACVCGFQGAEGNIRRLGRLKARYFYL